MRKKASLPGSTEAKEAEGSHSITQSRTETWGSPAEWSQRHCKVSITAILAGNSAFHFLRYCKTTRESVTGHVQQEDEILGVLTACAALKWRWQWHSEGLEKVHASRREGRGERLLPALPSAEHAAPGWPLSLRECLLLAVALYSLSCAQLFMAPSTVARRAPLAMGFPRQEH